MKPAVTAKPCDLLTLPEAARRLTISTKTVRNWVGSRKLGSVRLGARTLRVPAAEVARIISENTMPASEVA